MTIKKIPLFLSFLALVLTCPQEGYSILEQVGEVAETPLGAYKISKHFREIALPKSKLLQTPDVKDQGQIGTCVSFTATGLYETLNPGSRMSESEFTVYAETQIDDCVGGINMRNALAKAVKDGFIPEKIGPSYAHAYTSYVQGLNGLRNKMEQVCILHKDKQAAYNNAMEAMGSPLRLNGPSGATPYKLGELLPLYHVSKRAQKTTLFGGYVRNESGSIGQAGEPDFLHIKRALAYECPVAVAAAVLDTFMSPEEDDDYEINFPPKIGRRFGSHAFMLTGYDGDYFRVRNSWGESWGDNGYAWISSDYLAKCATEIVAVLR